jgi:hypothetical protein
MLCRAGPKLLKCVIMVTNLYLGLIRRLIGFEPITRYANRKTISACGRSKRPHGPRRPAPPRGRIGHVFSFFFFFHNLFST